MFRADRIDSTLEPFAGTLGLGETLGMKDIWTIAFLAFFTSAFGTAQQTQTTPTQQTQTTPAQSIPAQPIPPASLLGHTLGESFQQFSSVSITNRYKIQPCEQNKTWAGKHPNAAGLVASLLSAMSQSQLEQDIQGPKYILPDADHSEDCASYLSLQKPNASGEIGCDANRLCDGFLGGAAFNNGQLEALVCLQCYDSELQAN